MVSCQFTGPIAFVSACALANPFLCAPVLIPAKKGQRIILLSGKKKKLLLQRSPSLCPSVTNSKGPWPRCQRRGSNTKRKQQFTWAQCDKRDSMRRRGLLGKCQSMSPIWRAEGCWSGCHSEGTQSPPAWTSHRSPLPPPLEGRGS